MSMKNLECPDCQATVTTKKEKSRIALLGGICDCPECGAELVLGGRVVSTILGAIIGSAFMYIIIYALVMASIIPIVLTLLVVWLSSASIACFSGFKRVGTKRFHI